jgi:hypothetical protein
MPEMRYSRIDCAIAKRSRDLSPASVDFALLTRFVRQQAA